MSLHLNPESMEVLTKGEELEAKRSFSLSKPLSQASIFLIIGAQSSCIGVLRLKWISWYRM